MKLPLLKKLSGTIRSKRTHKSKGPITVGSISLAGSCFQQELDHHMKSYEVQFNHQLGNSLESVYSSEFELGTSDLASNTDSSGSTGSGTSRSCSIVTSGSSSNMLTPSPSEASLDLKPYLEDHKTLFIGKQAILLSSAPITA